MFEVTVTFDVDNAVYVELSATTVVFSTVGDAVSTGEGNVGELDGILGVKSTVGNIGDCFDAELVLLTISRLTTESPCNEHNPFFST